MTIGIHIAITLKSISKILLDYTLIQKRAVAPHYGRKYRCGVVFFQHNCKNKKWSFEEFYSFLLKLDPEVEKLEAQYLFSHIDKDDNEKLELSEVEQCLKESGIIKKAQNGIQRFEEQQILVDSNENYDLKTVFENFDKNKNDALENEEFSRMLMKVDKTLNVKDSVWIFRYFDDNKNNVVEFQEFYKKLADKVQAE